MLRITYEVWRGDYILQRIEDEDDMHFYVQQYVNRFPESRDEIVVTEVQTREDRIWYDLKGVI